MGRGYLNNKKITPKKSLVIGVLVGGIILGTSIGVAAATYFSASEVSFTPTDESWDVSNVEEALTDLYNTMGSNTGSDTSLLFYTNSANRQSSYTFEKTGTVVVQTVYAGYSNTATDTVFSINGVTPSPSSSQTFLANYNNLNAYTLYAKQYVLEVTAGDVLTVPTYYTYTGYLGVAG